MRYIFLLLPVLAFGQSYPIVSSLPTSNGDRDIVVLMSDSSYYRDTGGGWTKLGEKPINTWTKVGGDPAWTYQFVKTDSSNNTRATGTAIGALQWTALASTFYEVEYSIVDTSAAAATGSVYYWVASGALNRPAVLSVQSPTSATMGTDAFQEDNLTIAIAGTTADTTVFTARPYTSPQIVKMWGCVNTNATERMITLGWKSEIAGSAVTICRGSYVRYRKIY